LSALQNYARTLLSRLLTAPFSRTFRARINIEIGRSFIYRSFPQRAEYPYLASEWGCQTRDETRKTLHRLGNRFLPSPPFLLSSLVLRESVRLCPPAPSAPAPHLRLAFACISPWRLSGDPRILSSFARASFRSLYETHPRLFTPPWVLPSRSFVSRFSSVRRPRSILSGRSSLDHWPGRKLGRVRNPLTLALNPNRCPRPRDRVESASRASQRRLAVYSLLYRGFKLTSFPLKSRFTALDCSSDYASLISCETKLVNCDRRRERESPEKSSLAYAQCLWRHADSLIP